jgi:DNA-directed RNA polymerase subunit K/omega
MSGESEQTEATKDEASEAPAAEPAVERERMPVLESRFLYVDVSARRAKQLRRGALPRLQALMADPETGERPVPTSKLERIAMQEVDEGLVVYELPEPIPPVHSLDAS